MTLKIQITSQKMSTIEKKPRAFADVLDTAFSFKAEIFSYSSVHLEVKSLQRCVTSLVMQPKYTEEVVYSIVSRSLPFFCYGGRMEI